MPLVTSILHILLVGLSRHRCLSCGKISQPGLVYTALNNQVATVMASSQAFAASRNYHYLYAYTEGDGVGDLVTCSDVM